MSRFQAITMAVALALSAVAALTGIATGQENLVGVSVSPPRVESDLSGTSFAISVTFQNNETTPQRLRVSASGLGHDLDGTPLFLEPAIATEAIELSAKDFTLAPNQSRQVIARGSIPEGQRSLYAAVIAKFGPVTEEPAGQIEAESRVASIFLLRGPQPWRETAEVVDVSILPRPEGIKKGPLQVFAAVKDTGNVHIRPTGTVRLLQNGKTLDVVSLPGQNIIPDYARRLLGAWVPPKKLTGRVKLIASIRDPAARGIGYVDFTKGGEVAVPGAKIGNLVASNEDGPLVEFALTNTGTIPLGPLLSFSATRDGKPIDTEEQNHPELQPGESEVVTWRPELPGDGIYLISVEARLKEQVLDNAATGLRIGGEKTGGGIPVWVLVGGVLLLLLIIAMAFILGRRRSKDESSAQGSLDQVDGNGDREPSA